MQEFVDKTPAEMLEFSGSKPARAAQQFLAHHYPAMTWTVRSFFGEALEAIGAQYADEQGNTKVLWFQQRGIAWLISEDLSA